MSLCPDATGLTIPHLASLDNLSLGGYVFERAVFKNDSTVDFGM
jgi:hypothetical protein